MLNWLCAKISEPAVKVMLKSIAELFVNFLITLGVAEASKYVGKYLPVGGAIYGRRYALTLTVSERPPKDHPKAIHLGVVTQKGWGIEFHLWAVSFPKDKWEKIPDSQKIRLSK